MESFNEFPFRWQLCIFGDGVFKCMGGNGYSYIQTKTPAVYIGNRNRQLTAHTGTGLDTAEGVAGLRNITAKD